jgi:hypothetical protein
MNDKFTEIHDKARIDNYLAGTSQSPDRVKDAAQAAGQVGPLPKKTLGDTYRVDSAVRTTGGQSR